MIIDMHWKKESFGLLFFNTLDLTAEINQDMVTLREILQA